MQFENIAALATGALAIVGAGFGYLTARTNLETAKINQAAARAKLDEDARSGQPTVQPRVTKHRRRPDWYDLLALLIALLLGFLAWLLVQTLLPPPESCPRADPPVGTTTSPAPDELGIVSPREGDIVGPSVEIEGSGATAGRAYEAIVTPVSRGVPTDYPTPMAVGPGGKLRATATIGEANSTGVTFALRIKEKPVATPSPGAEAPPRVSRTVHVCRR